MQTITTQIQTPAGVNTAPTTVQVAAPVAAPVAPPMPVQMASPVAAPMAVPVAAPMAVTVSAPSKVPFHNGAPPPAAPPGYMYVYREQISPIPIICCILWFPLGLLFLLCAMERYWVLQPAPARGVAY